MSDFVQPAATSGAPPSTLPGTSVFLPPSQYLQLPRQAENWLIEPLIPTGGLVSLFSPPKAGKSFAALQLAVDVAQGADEWLGFPIRQSGPVAYLQLDTPRSLWAARLEAVERMGLDVSNLYLADSEQAPYPFDILQPDKGYEWLAQQCDALRPVLVIIDTLRELHGGDENDSGQMKQVVSAIAAATRPAAALVISHSRKSDPQRGDDLMNDNRGSSYVAGRMDTIMRLTPKTLVYKGRAIEECKLPLRRVAGGFWAVGVDEEDAITRVMADTSVHTLTDRADRLAEMLGKTREAARSILRRRLGAAAEQLSVISPQPAATQ